MGQPAAADVTTVLILADRVRVGLRRPARRLARAVSTPPRDGLFFRPFGRLHPRHDFPHVALLVDGRDHARSAASSRSATVIRHAAGGVRCSCRRSPRSSRSPCCVGASRSCAGPTGSGCTRCPSLLALAGWIYVFVSATSTSLILSTIWVVAGVVSFVIWARVNRAWPFGPLEVREPYLEEQRAERTEPAQVARDAVSA